MKVGVFTYVMLAVTMLWLQPEWLDAIGGPLARRGASWQPQWTRGRLALSAVLGALFLGTVTVPIIPRHLPRSVPAIVSWMGLDLPTSLFTARFPSVRWEASGTLADGSTADPLPVAAPSADFSDAFFNSLWMQLPYRMEQYGRLGGFICTRYNQRRQGAALVTWTLVRSSRESLRAGSAPADGEAREARWSTIARRDHAGRGWNRGRSR